jgi:ferrous iron transport protein B
MKEQIRIALAGNPNCGKTTLFNNLTGSTQYVGNWPGVTVEKEDGVLKGHKDVTIQDLPGIYSLSPYSQEEVVSRNYLVTDRPDAIIDIVDGTNIERNLYLTTQLLELGIPMVIALNMMDLVRKNGDRIDGARLGKELGCLVVPISALKGQGCRDAAEAAINVAKAKAGQELPHVFTGSVEHAIAHIEESISERVDEKNLRWYAIKLFERDKEVLKLLALPEELWKHLDFHIRQCEKEMEDDAESIITNQRYEYVDRILTGAVVKAKRPGTLTLSDKIDRVVTNRWLALPIFAGVMFLMYYISVTTLGGFLTDWVNDTLFGDWLTNGANKALDTIGAAGWLKGLLVEGIIGGVGTVLGFVPQMLLIFFFLAIFEDSGYMARVAFIMDRVFRRFGLSGKSFIPILIGTGCGVPAVMAARTIENERDRRMTIMLCTFIPCTAKTVIIGMITATFFPHSAWIAPAMYFLGIAIIVLAGIAFKKTRYFGGEPAPFVMELPAYHFPAPKGVLIHIWERSRAFIIKAGTIIFSACVVIWFLSNFSWNLKMVDMEQSMMANIGGTLAWIFAPLGFGNWKGTVAVISAEMAKEQAIGTLALLNGVAEGAKDADVMKGIATMFTPMGAFAFMVLNIFDPPCLVAIATIIREMGSKLWAGIAIGFQVLVGYGLAFVCYQIGSALFYGAGYGPGQYVAIVVIVLTAGIFALPSCHDRAEKKENISGTAAIN